VVTVKELMEELELVQSKLPSLNEYVAGTIVSPTKSGPRGIEVVNSPEMKSLVV